MAGVFGTTSPCDRGASRREAERAPGRHAMCHTHTHAHAKHGDPRLRRRWPSGARQRACTDGRAHVKRGTPIVGSLASRCCAMAACRESAQTRPTNTLRRYVSEQSESDLERVCNVEAIFKRSAKDEVRNVAWHREFQAA